MGPKNEETYTFYYWKVKIGVNIIDILSLLTPNVLTTPFLILLMCTITLLLSFTIFHHFLPFFYITFTTFYHILLIFTTFHGLLPNFILFFSFKKDFITFFSEINQSHHFVGCFAITGNSISVRNGGVWAHFVIKALMKLTLIIAYWLLKSHKRCKFYQYFKSIFWAQMYW